MFGILHAITDVKSLKARLDDDFADRLNRQYTCVILFVFIIIVSTKSYIGDPVQCWCHNSGCAGSQEKYINMYCWVTQTYRVPFDGNAPHQGELREHKIAYYQWVPFIFLFQAMLFFLPSLLWQGLNRRSGINIGVIVEAARVYQKQVKEEKREKTLTHAVQLLERYFQAQRQATRGVLAACKGMLSTSSLQYTPWGRFGGCYLTFWYFIIKVLYTVNAIGQFFLLDKMLGHDFSSFGIQWIKTLARGDKWVGLDVFPIVTYCDLQVRQHTNVQPFTFQCVLAVNMINEKLFTVLWFWILMVCVVTAFSLLKWLYRMTYWPSQFRFIKRQLNAMGLGGEEAEMVRNFTRHYIRKDGILVLKLVSKNAGDVVATEMLCGLWEQYRQRYELPDSETVDTMVAVADEKMNISGSADSTLKVRNVDSNGSRRTSGQIYPSTPKGGANIYHEEMV